MLRPHFVLNPLTWQRRAGDLQLSLETTNLGARMLIILVHFLSLIPSFAEAPINFFQVDEFVMRGGAINQKNANWLANQGVRQIIKLDDENPDETTYGIPLNRFHINKFGLNLKYKKVLKILDAIEKAKDTGRVYVHCERGSDRTGLIIALYRITQLWSVSQARYEMNEPRFGHSKLQIWIDHKFELYAKKLSGDLEFKPLVGMVPYL